MKAISELIDWAELKNQVLACNTQPIVVNSQDFDNFE